MAEPEYHIVKRRADEYIANISRKTDIGEYKNYVLNQLEKLEAAKAA